MSDEESDESKPKTPQETKTANSLFLRSEGGYYTGKLVDDKPEGYGYITWDNGNTFEGMFKDGKKDGKGKKVNKDGSKFEGTYLCNIPIEGHYIWPDGTEYKGQWKNNGKFHGKGVKINANGTKYDGNWVDGKPQGFGTCSYADGSKYEGYWKNGLFEGQGTKTFKDGTLYRGTWQQGKLVKGTCTKPHGKSYEGEWKNFKLHGKGTKIYPDGSRFTGKFEDGRPVGTGKRTFADGKVQKGEWQGEGDKLKWVAIESQEIILEPRKCRKESGEERKSSVSLSETSSKSVDSEESVRLIESTKKLIPEHISKEGKKLSQFSNSVSSPDKNDGRTFEPSNVMKFNNKEEYLSFQSIQANISDPDKKHRLEFPDGSYYEGYLDKGKFSGFGELVFAKNSKVTDHHKESKYVGNWKEGLYDGNGVFTWPNGSTYDGNWSKGRETGIGTFKSFDGVIYEGEWGNGKYHGKGKLYEKGGKCLEGEFLFGNFISKE